MADPAILIPSGLRAVHPQLEESLKSIDGAIRSLRQGQQGKTNGAGSSDASIAALRQQVQALQQQVAAVQAQLASSSTATGYLAAEMLPAFSLVYEAAPGQVALADNSDGSTSYAVVGITTMAVAQGATVALAVNGDTVNNDAWSWAAVQPVFLDVDGGLTQVMPSAGFTAPVGVAVSATSILLTVGEPAGFSDGNTDAVLGRAAAGQLNAQWLPLLPSLSAVEQGRTVTVPAFCNLLTMFSSGMQLDGDVVLDGDWIEGLA